MKSTVSSAKILPVTSIRFFAALYVVCLHLSQGVPWFPATGVLNRFVTLGYVSVSFFFFLSGFVLSIAYLGRKNQISLRKFYVARFARIYPVLFVCLLLDVPHFLYAQIHLFHASTLHLLRSFSVSFGVLEAWFAGIQALDTPSWSIAVEFFFYLLFPFLGPLIWRLSTRATWLLAAALYSVGVGIILFLMNFQIDRYTFGLNPLTHLYEFLLGICLAKLYLFLSQEVSWRHRVSRLAPTGFLASLALFLAIPIFNIKVPDELLQHGILLPLYGVTILALSSGNHLVSTVFSHRWLVIVGDASFALYLLHEPLGLLMRRIIAFSPFFGPFVYVSLAIALSVLSFLYFEGPALRWIVARFQVKTEENTIVRNLAQ